MRANLRWALVLASAPLCAQGEESASLFGTFQEQSAPCIEKTRGFLNGRIDVLYWRADEDGLEYGTQMTANPIIGSSSSTHTKLLDLDYDWDPGVRLGVGYAFNHFNSWCLNLTWTHIRNKAQGHASAQGIESQTGSVNTIISPWVNLLFELRAGASKASAHWHIDYNTLDLDLGRNIRPTSWFTCTPFVGLRGALLDQHYKANYNSVFLLAEGEPTFTREVTFKAKNDFSGFGIRGGTDLIFNLSANWHLFSHLAANILYGKFRVHMKNLNDQGLGEGDTPPMPLDFFASEHLKRVRLNFEEAVGIGWGMFFRCNRYRLAFRLAYEMSQWIAQNQLFYTFYFRGQDAISSVPIRNQGNLSFHGIRIGLQIDF